MCLCIYHTSALLLLTRQSFTVSQIFHRMLSDKPRAKMLIGFLYSLLLAVGCVWEIVLKVLCNYTCLTAEVKVVNLLSQVLRREKMGGLPLLLSKQLIFIMDSWIRCQAAAGVHLNCTISNLCVVKLAVLLENVTPVGVVCILCGSPRGDYCPLTVLGRFCVVMLKITVPWAQKWLSQCYWRASWHL